MRVTVCQIDSCSLSALSETDVKVSLSDDAQMESAETYVKTCDTAGGAQPIHERTAGAGQARDAGRDSRARGTMRRLERFPRANS
jgi:hypothetical protein